MTARRMLFGVGAGPLLVVPVEHDVVDTDTLGTGGTDDWWGRPAMKQRSDGVVILVYARATAHGTVDGDIHIRFSDDDCATWTAEDTLLAADGGGAVGLFPLNPGNPAAAAGEAGFEPWLVATPTPDEFLLHTWAINYPTSMGGTYQWRTTDGGVTWTAEGMISWGGLTSAESERTMATDQDVIVGSTIFVGIRTFSGETSEDPSAVGFASSTDEGATWTKLATLVAASAFSSHGTQEVGFTRVGDRFLAIIRDVPQVTHTYAMWSDDLTGTSWGSLEDWTSELGVMGRGRLYTRAQIKGIANWWLDPVLILTGFEHTTPGSGYPRRNALWVTRDSGATWDGPLHLDVTDQDGGYSDIFWDAANRQYVVVSYKGPSTNASDLKQYRVTIDGI